jgi:hypothetical protein
MVVGLRAQYASLDSTLKLHYSKQRLSRPMANQTITNAPSAAHIVAADHRRSVSRWQSAAIAGLFAVLACALTVFLFWTTDRGFDIWDEGFYLIMSQHPADVGAYPGSYYYYTGLLFSLAHMDLPTFRCLGIISVFASTIVLAAGLREIDTALPARTFSSGGAAGFVALTAFLYLGTLVYYGSMARTTPSYNLVTSICLTAATGTTLIALAATSHGHARRAVAWLLVTGLLIALQFFAKAPSAALLGITVTALIALWPMPATRALSRYRLFVALATGTAAGLALHFAIFETPRAFVEKAQSGLEYLRHVGVRTDSRFLWQTVVANGNLIGSMIKQSWPAAIVLAVLFWSWGKLHRRAPHVLTPLCWAAVAGIVFAHIAARYYVGGYFANNLAWRQVGLYFFWASALFALLWGLGAFRAQTGAAAAVGRRQEFLLMGLLGMMPFIGAFGTTFPSQIVLTYNYVLAPWFALLIYLAARLEAHGLPLRIPAQVAIAGFAAVQLVTGYLSAPYGNLKGALDLRSTIAVGDPPSRLLVAQDARDAIEALKAAGLRCGFKAGDRILAFYAVPGIVYALGGRIVKFPAFTGALGKSTELSIVAAEHALKSVPYDEAHNAFVLTQLNGPGLRVPDLKAIGRTLPGDYELCGEGVWPVDSVTIRLWKPNGL